MSASSLQDTNSVPVTRNDEDQTLYVLVADPSPLRRRNVYIEPESGALTAVDKVFGLAASAGNACRSP